MYICCHRAGKAKDLYSRSFLLDEKTLRKGERVARERQSRQGERQREVVSGELEEDCHESGKKKGKMTGTKRGKGEEVEKKRRGGWTEGAGARLSENGQDK